MVVSVKLKTKALLSRLQGKDATYICGRGQKIKTTS